MSTASDTEAAAANVALALDVLDPIEIALLLLHVKKQSPGIGKGAAWSGGHSLPAGCSHHVLGRMCSLWDKVGPSALSKRAMHSLLYPSALPRATHHQPATHPPGQVAMDLGCSNCQRHGR